MILDKAVVTELSQIKWLDNCGKEPPHFLFPNRQVSGWKNVKIFFEDGWLDRTGEAQGDLTEFLSVHHPSSYQGIWNKLVREARQAVEIAVGGRAAEVAMESELGDDLTNSVKWYVLNTVMEISYKSLNPPIFFARLMDVYRKGHLPCGLSEDDVILFY